MLLVFRFYILKAFHLMFRGVSDLVRGENNSVFFFIFHCFIYSQRFRVLCSVRSPRNYIYFKNFLSLCEGKKCNADRKMFL